MTRLFMESLEHRVHLTNDLGTHPYFPARVADRGNDVLVERDGNTAIVESSATKVSWPHHATSTRVAGAPTPRLISVFQLRHGAFSGVGEIESRHERCEAPQLTKRFLRNISAHCGRSIDRCPN